MKDFEKLKNKIKENFLTRFETEQSINFCSFGNSFFVFENGYDDGFTICLLKPDGELSGKYKEGKTIKTVISFVEKARYFKG
jgi:hypothetical protein